MTALISCTSNTMLNINRPYIDGERWFGIFVMTALMFSPQQGKHRDFTNLPDNQFDQYVFILRISIFEMPAMLSCTSNTVLDRNRPQIGGERRFGISVATALVMQ